MSYCRIGVGSDVYVIRSGVNGMLVCYCALVNNEHEDPEGMISHLLIHRSFGHKVPERAFERLQAERLGLPFKTDIELALEEFRDTDPRDWSRATDHDTPGAPGV